MTTRENGLPKAIEEETALDEFLKALGDLVENTQDWVKPSLKKGRYWLRIISAGIILCLVTLVVLAWTLPVSSRITAIPTIALVVPSMMLLILVFRWPLISLLFGAIGTSSRIVRKILGWILIATFFELAIGIYLSLVPIDKSPELIPLRVSIPVAMATLGIGAMLLEISSKKWVKRSMTILTLILIVLTVLSFIGTDEVGKFFGDVEDWFGKAGDWIEGLFE